MTIPDGNDAYVGYHTATGELMRIELDIGRSPPDGADRYGLIVHRISSLGGLTEDDWLRTKVWYGNEYITVSEKPNQYAFWAGNQSPPAWDWDVNHILSEVRERRNRALIGTDFAVLPDSPLTEEQQEEVMEYRGRLRQFPASITWKIAHPDEAPIPEPPSFLSSSS